VNDSGVRVCAWLCVPTKYASGSVASGAYVFVRELVNCVVSATAVWVRAAAALSDLAVTPPRVQDMLGTCTSSELHGMHAAGQSTLQLGNFGSRWDHVELARAMHGERHAQCHSECMCDEEDMQCKVCNDAT